MTTSESTRNPLRRRVLSISRVSVGAVVALLLSPALLIVAAVVDLFRHRRFVLTRCVVFGVTALWIEVIGICVAGLIWPLTPLSETFASVNFRLQCWWARSLYRAAVRMLALDVEIDTPLDLKSGPMIVLVRHTSLAETLLPAVLISDPFGIRLRWVMKRELLADPCLDIVGNRLPNYFVDRSASESAGEIDAIGRLGEDLGSDGGVVIFPEGTRFTPERRMRLIERLSNNPEEQERAASYSSVLPVRPGGTAALMDSAVDADIVVVLHTGFERTTRLGDLLGGSLVGARLRVAVWRIDRADVPGPGARRLDWLDRLWHDVDAWVVENSGKERPGS